MPFIFTVVDVVHLGYWLLATTLPITHRSPWGLWTKKREQKFTKERAIAGGPSPAAYGTLWIFLKFMLSFAFFIFFRQYQSQDQGIYIAMFFVAHIHILLSKIQEALYFDYDLYAASAWIAFVLFSTLVAALVLLGITGGNAMAGEEAPAWVSFGLIIPNAIWWMYMTWVAYRWYVAFENRGKASIRKRQRLMINK